MVGFMVEEVKVGDVGQVDVETLLSISLIFIVRRGL